MKERLLQFLSAENLSKAQFADTINVTRASISHLMSGRNNPSYEFIVNTMDAFPDLNMEWLLKGKGKMYKSAKEVDDIPHFGLFSEPEEPKTEEKPVQEPVIEEVKISLPPQKGRVKKIVLLYDDDTYQEFS